MVRLRHVVILGPLLLALLGGGGGGRREGDPAAVVQFLLRQNISVTRGMQVAFDAAAEVTNLCGRAIPHLSLTELCPWQKHEE